jgi:transcriptional regulator with XRE-family HTH domain
MSMRVLRKRNRTKTQNRPTPALSFTLKVAVPMGSGIHARYPLGVTADGGINREAWARVVNDLRAAEAKGKTAPFARKIGVDPRTVDRWLRQQVAVKEENIRTVARALDRNPVELLVQVGYYRPNEIAPPAVPDPREDPIVSEILADPHLTEEQRAELVQIQLDRIEADLFRRREEYLQLRRLFGKREAS